MVYNRPKHIFSLNLLGFFGFYSRVRSYLDSSLDGIQLQTLQNI